MKIFLAFISCLLSFLLNHAQTPVPGLQDAVRRFELDPQMAHGIVGFYIAESKTGNLVYQKNGELGFAIASSQKVFTSAAAFELLGPEYQYKTSIAYTGNLVDGVLQGDVWLHGSGDPSLGSWRWKSTSKEKLPSAIITALKNAGIKRINGAFLVDNRAFSIQPIPEGWIWQDIGNYYGSGSWAVNWNENQYDLFLKPGKAVGDPTTIVRTNPDVKLTGFINDIRTGERGSGDNAYIYLPVFSSYPFATGTIPLGVSSFSISGAIPNPAVYLCTFFDSLLRDQGIKPDSGCKVVDGSSQVRRMATASNAIYTHLSPPFDSLNHWFLKRSINLYGEAFLKTIAFEKEGTGSTEKGVKLLQDFLKTVGIEKNAVTIMDGSGLSPQNRVTPKALVQLMLYARNRPWFSSFYDALPEINGIRMKSGSIGGVRSFTGYITSKQGKTFSFAIVVNNYNGSASEVVRKMYRLLDLLK